MPNQDLRSKVFRRRPRGYRTEDVDRLMRLAADELEAGRSPALPILEARFKVAYPGYDVEEVDQFLDTLVESPSTPTTHDVADLSSGPSRSELRCERDDGGHALSFQHRRRRVRENRSHWEQFPQLPGTHITRRKIGHRTYELVTDSGEALGIMRERRARAHAIGLQTFTLAGRVYRMENVGKAQSNISQLVNVTGEPNVVLTLKGRHWGGMKDSVVTLTNGHWFRFPVQGHSPGTSVMTAVNEAGQSVASFRRGRSWSGSRAALAQHRIEVVVDPNQEVTTELLLIIAVASGFVCTWYAHQGGGGGG